MALVLYIGLWIVLTGIFAAIIAGDATERERSGSMWFLIVLFFGIFGALVYILTVIPTSKSSDSSNEYRGTNKREELGNGLASTGDPVRLKLIAMTKMPQSGEASKSTLTIQTSDISEAKYQFRQHCQKEGLDIISEIETEVVE